MKLTGMGEGSYPSSNIASAPDRTKSSIWYDNTLAIPAPAVAALTAASIEFTTSRDGIGMVSGVPFERKSQLLPSTSSSYATQSCTDRSVGVIGTPRVFK